MWGQRVKVYVSILRWKNNYTSGSRTHTFLTSTVPSLLNLFSKFIPFRNVLICFRTILLELLVLRLSSNWSRHKAQRGQDIHPLISCPCLAAINNICLLSAIILFVSEAGEIIYARVVGGKFSMEIKRNTVSESVSLRNHVFVSR